MNKNEEHKYMKTFFYQTTQKEHNASLKHISLQCLRLRLLLQDAAKGQHSRTL
jgi:hypothetical protein